MNQKCHKAVLVRPHVNAGYWAAAAAGRFVVNPVRLATTAGSRSVTVSERPLLPTAITAALSVSALRSTTSITGPVQRWRCQIKRYICICYIQAYFLLRSHFIYFKTLTTQSHLNSDLCLLRKHQFPLQNLEEKNKTSLSKERVFLCHFRAFSPTPVLGSLLPFPCNKIDYPLAFLSPCDLALHITGHSFPKPFSRSDALC